MKTHILESDSPIQQDTTVIAACGAQIRNVKALQVFDEENPVLSRDPEIAETIRRFGECQKCKAITERKRYRYTVANNQEILAEGEL